MPYAVDAQSIHLLAEFIEIVPVPAAHTATAPLPATSALKLELKAGPAFLVAAPGQTPRLQETLPESMQHTAVLEPIYKSHSAPRLLVINPAGEPTKVNGAIAPRFAVVHERDNFQINSAFAFHITLFNNPRIGPPRADSAGQTTCAVCTKILEANSKVLECIYCGAELHFEDDPGLDCASLVVNCPACSKPLVKVPSATFEPVF